MSVARKALIPLFLAIAVAYAAGNAEAPVGELFAGGASVRGSVVLVGGGASVLGGSQVSAGDGTALLKLARGGEVRICPRTSLSINTSPTGNELMLGVNNGALELHYTLGTGTDTVMTPDFRIQMIGPGSFHLALSADAAGNTCVRPLEGMGAGVIVSEVMGTASYQVAPDSAVHFSHGQVSTAKRGDFANCGCPAPKPSALQAAAPPPAPPIPPPPPPEAKLPPELHLQVDTPMIYRGDAPGPVYSASQLTTAQASDPPRVQPPPAPPAAEPVKPAASTAGGKRPEKKPGLVRRFFAKLFGSK
jgi:hypothetical protein